MDYAPHHRHYVAELPPQGEALTKARITIFAEKMKFTEFFFRQGEGSERGKFITKFFAEIFA